MRRLLELQNTVERIRSETSQDIPGLAINILMSVGLKNGLSTTDLVSKLDVSYGEINCGLGLLTARQNNEFNCAGLLCADQQNTFFLTDKGTTLVGDLGCRLNDYSQGETMESSRFTTDFGKEIYMLNFEYDKPEEALPIIDECARQVRQRSEKSVLTLTVVSRGAFNPEVVNKLKELTKGNVPYVRKAAVVGVTGLYKVVMMAVSIFSKRDFRLFDSKEDAISYLLQD